MSIDLIRYYFYLSEDEETFAIFKSDLNANNVPYRYISADNIEDFKQSCFLQIKTGNVEILIVRISGTEHSPAEKADLLDSYEKTAHLTPDILLGKVSVWTAYEIDHEEIKNVLQIHKKEAFQMKIIDGSLSRMNFFWPRGHAQYICAMKVKNSVDELFLAGGLPLIEAGMIQLHLIANLYRERSISIDKQTQDLDKRLTIILHNDLVSRQSQAIQADELESQLNELAKSYGITAGNKNIIQEGINRVSPLLDNIARQIRSEKALIISSMEIDNFIEPFKLRLENLVTISQNLDISLQSQQAAIDVVESKVGIMNSRQNIATQEKIRNLLELNSTMQKQSLIFQISAAAIEFIVIAYYSHSLWKAMSPDAYHIIPGWIQLIFVLLFSANIVFCTHIIGEYIQDKENKHVKKNLLISLIPLVVILVIVIVSSFLLGAASH